MHALNDVAAPAKLNLFLHIVGRRADGYHLLQSAFMLIDWQDTLQTLLGVLAKAMKSTDTDTRLHAMAAAAAPL